MQTKNKMQIRVLLRIAPLFVGVFAILFFTSGDKACAQASACDPQYFSSLKSRAWLEAQREITQNQNLIFKPDSVFEYTCFDRYLNELADHAKDMFSETQRWGPIPGIDLKSTDRALQALVGQPLQTYLLQNFESDGNGPVTDFDGDNTYDLLGGRSAGIDHTPEDIDGGGFQPIPGSAGTIYVGADYSCDIMQRIWDEAKCMDFIQNATHDGFFTFEEYRDYINPDTGDPGDHRFLPKECAHVARWEDQIKLATVNGDPPDGTPWKEDLVQVYFDRLEPDSCFDVRAVPTGVTVFRAQQDPKEYEEYVCVAPGCYFQPDALQRTGGGIGVPPPRETNNANKCRDKPNR